MLIGSMQEARSVIAKKRTAAWVANLASFRPAMAEIIVSDAPNIMNTGMSIPRKSVLPALLR